MTSSVQLLGVPNNKGMPVADDEEDSDEMDGMPAKKPTFHSFRSMGNEAMLASLPRNNESIMGPKDPSERRVFYICAATLVVAGAANDFLGKTIYQILPGVDSGWVGLVNDHWITLCLAMCAFAASSMAIYSGRQSFKLMNWSIARHLLIPSFMDFLVTASRYLALVFLPAAMVTILKSGLQLAALSVVRRIRGKILGLYQWIGLGIIIFGLSVVALHTVLVNLLTDSLYTVADTMYGLLIMFFVGIEGAVRNTAEEILLKEHKLDPFFIVGAESILSLLCAVTVGVVFLIFEVHLGNVSYADVPESIGSTFSTYPAIAVCVCLFMTVVYLKDTMQMKVTLMSSAMTRKLFQQLYPLFTFTFSLVLHLIANETTSMSLGESWDNYTYIELLGFAIVLYGAYLYFLEPKYGMPDWLLTRLGISNANPHAGDTDMIDRKASLLDSDYLMGQGIDTAGTLAAETKQTRAARDSRAGTNTKIVVTGDVDMYGHLAGDEKEAAAASAAGAAGAVDEDESSNYVSL